MKLLERKDPPKELTATREEKAARVQTEAEKRRAALGELATQSPVFTGNVREQMQRTAGEAEAPARQIAVEDQSVQAEIPVQSAPVEPKE